MASDSQAVLPRAGLFTVSEVIEKLNSWASHVAHGSLWLLSAVVFYDVILRSLGHPTLWGSELSVYLMLAIAFLGAGHTSSEGGHFRVTVLIDLMGPRARRFCDLLTALLGLVFTVLFTHGAYKLAAFAFQLSFHTPTYLRVPVGLLQGIVFVGGVFLALALFQDIVRIALGEKRRESEIIIE